MGVGAWLFIQDRRRTHEFVRQRLASRPPLSPGEFGKTDFGATSSKAGLAGEAREILARYIDVPLDGLLPDDAFAKDLRMDDLDSMASVEFVTELERHFGLKIPGKDARAIYTFRELIDYLERRMAGSSPAPGEHETG